MAKTVTINGVTYQNVPHVEIPLSGGSGNAVFRDTADATVDATKILQGYTAYGANGQVTGTLTTPQVSQDSTSKVLSIV